VNPINPTSDDRPFVENSADAKQIKQARKREKATERDHIERVKRVLETPDGRHVFRHYLGLCGVFRGGRSTLDELQFNEGQRNIGLRMLLDVEQARPDLISIMKDT